MLYKTLQKDVLKQPSAQEMIEQTQRAAERWRAMSEAEEEPYCTEARAASAHPILASLEWWRTADQRLVRAVNRVRAAQNKKRLFSKRAQEDRKPPNAYAVYVSFSSFPFP